LTHDGNRNQAFPVLTSATLANTGTVITGRLASTPNTAFTLEFFANDVCNHSGYGEGQSWLGDAVVVTDANGQASFTATVAGANVGQFIAATATDALNDTSAFSACVEVTTPSRAGEIVIAAQADATQSVATSPVPLNSSRAVGSADSSSSAVLPRTTVNGAARLVHSGVASRRGQAEADLFWQEFGRSSLAEI
jgi:hypothetical protein